jgi:sigma-B regulation protein RsbU (phosphoserine phosphatase)
MKRQCKRISVKLTLMFGSFALLLCALIGAFSYIESYRAYTDFYSEKVQQIVRTAAELVDGDAIRGYIETGETDEYYEELRKLFSDIKRGMDISYLYIFVPYDDHFIYVLDAQTEWDDPQYIAALGERFDYTEEEYKFLLPDVTARRASEEKRIVRVGMVNDISAAVEAWAPVFTSDGELAAMVEGDLSIAVVHSELTRFILIVITLSSLIVLAAAALLTAAAHRMVTRPLTRIAKNARGLIDAEGERIRYISDIRTGDEFQELSEALESMSRDLEEHTKRVSAVAAAEERIATERGVVSEMQTMLLPHSIVSRDDFAVAGLLENGRDISGVFYDFFTIDDERLGVVMASASGRGMPTALYAVVAKTIIKGQMIGDGDVSEVMSIVNTRLFDASADGVTLSAFVGTLNYKTGSLTYVNAAFPQPILVQNSGGYSRVPGQLSAPLGESRNVNFRQNEIKLAQGDRLAFYTESLTELRAGEGDERGDDRLRLFLTSGRGRAQNPEELLRNARDELVVGAASKEAFDGFGLLILEFRRGDKMLSEISTPPRAAAFSLVQKFLKRQLMEENGLNGAFYAVTSVSAEELFVLAARRSPAGTEITVRCGVRPGCVEIGLLYGGELEDPLPNLSPREQDAIAFVKKHAAKLTYLNDGTRNVLTMMFDM